jgi:hypothetical protein
MNRVQPILLLLAIGLPAAQLTGCMQLPPAVAAEMQPAVPPAANHYRKPPEPATAPQRAEAAR